MRLEVAEPPFVPLDLLAHPRELLLHVEHVLELAGPGGEQVDEPRLEPPRVGHPGGDIHVLLADVLRAHVHGLELPDRGEAGQRLLEAIGRDLDLEAGGAELAASGLHRGVGDVATHPAGQRPHHRHRGLERVYLDARLSGTNDHHSGRVPGADAYAIYHDFAPQASDIVIWKQRASAFQGTPLFSHLSLLGVQSLIVCGESTSGCVRASVVDAYSNGFHISIVEECTFDRAELTHKVNLFDLHHKYADVMHLEEVVAHLDGMRMDRAAE